ncbi:UNVERIFIED_CONTAM: hypothetical protein K2H54_040357 [Gekko kuhli]
MVIDGSGSIGAQNFELVKQFVNRIVDFLEVSAHGTRVGLVQYASTPRTEFPLNRYTRAAEIKAAVQRVRYMAGGTMTGLGIKHMLEQSFSTWEGARPVSQNVGRIGLVFTDGQSGDNVAQWATKAKESGIVMYAVGVGNAAKQELQAIASEPVDEHFFYATDFNAMQQIASKLKSRICDGPKSAPISCPENSHYETCGNGCPATCSDRIAPLMCKNTCAAICQCNEGYVRDGDRCVPMNTCNCTHNGISYRPGEEFWEDEGCHSRCKCYPEFGRAVCQKSSCKANQKCTTVNGVRDCHTSCPENSHYETCGNGCPATCSDRIAPLMCKDTCAAICQCNEGYVRDADRCVPMNTCNCTHNGISYRPGEEFWEDEGCHSRCKCYPESGRAVCQKSSCKANQKCTTVNGVRDCRTSSHFTCIGTGDPHYTSFDGKKFDFMGTCVYQMAAVCSKDPALTPFLVTVQNNNRGSKAVSYTKVVTLEVYGMTISLSQEYPRKIQVNGAFVDLPFSYEDKLKVYISGVHGFIKTDFDLRVSFDWYSYARVIIPNTYANAICGLCGNANQDPGDDFTMKDGTQTTDEIQFADSWKVKDVPGCSAGCTSNCQVCGEADKVPYKSNTHCGVLIQKDGPFRQCHEAIDPTSFFDDCVFDTCMYKGHRDTLCSSISAYVTACQAQGIQVGPWRSASFCNPLFVPPAILKGPFDPQKQHFGENFDFHGSCTYTLAKVCSEDPQLERFSVLVENEKSKDSPAVLIKNVMASIHGLTVVLERGMKWKAMVDGELHTLPINKDGGKLWITQEGNNIIIQSSFGFTILYDTLSYVRVSVPNSYQGHMCGLGGNFNGDKSDDFMLPNGKLAQDVVEFGASWKVPIGDVSCSDDCGEKCPTCDAVKTAPYKSERSCGLILSKTGPFRDCHQLESPTHYFEHCLYDMCVSNGAQESLCRSIRAYVTACQVAGAKVEAWRTDTFCPLTCPANSHYETCTMTCDSTCASLSTVAKCTRKCFEGCQCNDGYAFDGDTCVPLDRCGCVHNGLYFKARESLFSRNCTEKCTCTASSQFTCEETSCPAELTCALKDGVRGCVTREGQCKLTPGGQLTSFDRASAQYLCNGVYDVVSVCNESALSWFRVSVRIEEEEGGLIAGKTVYVHFREASIIVRKNRGTWVNGRLIRLPYKISKAVSLSNVHDGILIDQASQMQVHLHHNGGMTVRVKDNLAGKLCAPCGNFNGEIADDLRTPNREKKSIAEVLHAWKAKDISC